MCEEHYSGMSFSAWITLGQTFCDLPTHLHHFYHVFHAIRINKCIFFLVYSLILGIFSVALSSKHMWGSVQVIWMILACATYQHFIYHPCEHHVQKFSTIKLDKIIFSSKYTWLLWTFPDLRVQLGSHCGRPMWHYKRLIFV